MAIVLEDGSAMILALVLTILELWMGNVIEGSKSSMFVFEGLHRVYVGNFAKLFYLFVPIERLARLAKQQLNFLFRLRLTSFL